MLHAGHLWSAGRGINGRACAGAAWARRRLQRLTRNRVNAERAWARANDCTLTRARLAGGRRARREDPDPGRERGATWPQPGIARGGVRDALMGADCTADFEGRWHAPRRERVPTRPSALPYFTHPASAPRATRWPRHYWIGGATTTPRAHIRRRSRVSTPAGLRPEMHRWRTCESLVAFAVSRMPPGGLDSVFTTEPGRIRRSTRQAGSCASARPNPRSSQNESHHPCARASSPRGYQFTRHPLLLAGLLSTPASEALIAQYKNFANAATIDPDAWIITASGTAGFPAIHSSIQVRLVHASIRAVVVRQRTW